MDLYKLLDQRFMPEMSRNTRRGKEKEGGRKGSALPPLRRTDIRKLGITESLLPIEITIDPEVFMEFLRYQTIYGPGETSGIGWVEEEKIKRVEFVPHEQSSCVGVKRSGSQISLAMLRLVEAGYPGSNLAWHTHPDMNVRWSYIDLADQFEVMSKLKRGIMYFLVLNGFNASIRKIDLGTRLFTDAHLKVWGVALPDDYSFGGLYGLEPTGIINTKKDSRDEVLSHRSRGDRIKHYKSDQPDWRDSGDFRFRCD